MAVLIFVAIIFAWALFLGRFMGGTGTWLPTGGRESAPEPVCDCFAGEGELHLTGCPLESDENLAAVEARLALVDDPDAGLSDAAYWAELSA